MKQHPGRHLPRQQFGFWLNQAWGKSATSGTISGFRAAGVFPLNPEAIPEYTFSGNIEQSIENNFGIAPQVQSVSDTY